MDKHLVTLSLSTVTDAIFFLHNGKVVKEMMLSEFDALLDGVFELEELKGKQVQAVHVQITDSLKIKGLVFFLVGFTPEGNVDADWNLPIHQLMQSAGRGPDLGAGAIRLVCKRQCTVPWHKESLWDPNQKTFELLVKAVQANRLGVVESDEAWDAGWEDGFEDVPTVAPTLSPAPPVLMAEPPVLTPTLVADDDVPILEIPVAVSASGQGSAAASALSVVKKEFDALKAATSVKIDRLQKERDALKEKIDSQSESIKKQAKDHLESISRDFKQDLEKKEMQIAALKAQLDNERKRYAELKEQHVEQAAGYNAEREELMDQLQKNQDVDSGKIGELKEAFRKELNARVEAEVSKVNEFLAMREVELFYREEQISLLRNSVSQLKAEKQAILKDSGSNILQALENNGVTFVAFHPGVGHVTLPVDDIGRYLDERTSYLADRCNVTPEEFAAWQEHYNNPVCHHSGRDGHICGKQVARVELVSQFRKGRSDMCDAHRASKP